MKPCVGQLLFCIFPVVDRERARQISCVGGFRSAPNETDLPAPRAHRYVSIPIPPTRTRVRLSRFGFSRLFEFPTLACFPQRESRSASSQEFLQQRRATHSFDRTLGSTVFPSCTWRQTEMEANLTQDQPMPVASTAGDNQLWLSWQGLWVPAFFTQQHDPTPHQ